MKEFAVPNSPRSSAGHRVAVVGLLALALSGQGLAGRGEMRQVAGNAVVAYPDGYRDWVHVKTGLVSARHKDFERTGGFRHIYANPPAAIGYRTGAFPEGSVIVVDWLEATDADGAFSEGTRRRLDVMVKDGTRFGATRGWGFESFKGDTPERLVKAAATECVPCHSGPDARDMVFSTFHK